MAKSWHVANIPFTPTAASAKPMDNVSGALPQNVTLIAGPVTVYAMWKAPDAESDPTVAEVLAGGFPISQAQPITLKWTETDNVAQDPTLLFFAATSAGGDIRAIS
mgnify:FL=1